MHKSHTYCGIIMLYRLSSYTHVVWIFSYVRLNGKRSMAVYISSLVYVQCVLKFLFRKRALCTLPEVSTSKWVKNDYEKRPSKEKVNKQKIT